MDLEYMRMAYEIAGESHCMRRKVGSVLVSESNQYVLKAVNDPMPQKEICERLGCLRELKKIKSGTQLDICRCIHSETNLIIQCALRKISPQNATLYSTLFPCHTCAKILAAAGIKRIVYAEPYPDNAALEILNCAQIKIEQLKIVAD